MPSNKKKMDKRPFYETEEDLTEDPNYIKYVKEYDDT